MGAKGEDLVNDLQVIQLDATSPFERGVQYGEQARDKINAGIRYYRKMFDEFYKLGWERALECAMGYSDVSEEFFAEAFEEAHGISHGAEVSFAEIMLLNCRYEITKFPIADECTSFAVLSDSTRDREVFVGQNWDYYAGILDHIVMIRLEQRNGVEILGLAEAGQLIRNGMNSAGIGLCANSLRSIFDRPIPGVPSTFLRRRVLNCASLQEAIEVVAGTKSFTSCNVMLASSENAAVDLEIFPNGIHKINPDSGVMTHANHFVSDPSLNKAHVSPRGDRLRDLLRKQSGDITVSQIEKCLCDHHRFPDSICRHPSDAEVPLEFRTLTVASVVYGLRSGVAHICCGPPCEGEFNSWELR